MAFPMTALDTCLNPGFLRDFLMRWMVAFAIAWPCAILAGFIAIAITRKATAHIVKMIEG